jgi:CHASE1-domain containing sensor protein
VAVHLHANQKVKKSRTATMILGLLLTIVSVKIVIVTRSIHLHRAVNCSHRHRVCPPLRMIILLL